LADEPAISPVLNRAIFNSLHYVLSELNPGQAMSLLLSVII